MSTIESHIRSHSYQLWRRIAITAPEPAPAFTTILDWLVHARFCAGSSSPTRLVIVHQNADLDAIGSAIGLVDCFGPLAIGGFGGISRPARRLIEYTGHTFLDRPPLDRFTSALVIDTGSPALLGTALDVLPIPLSILDHHDPSDSWRAYDPVVAYHVDAAKSSCAELVYDLIVAADRTASMTASTALALIVAILADTGHFRYATASTLRIVAELMERHQLSAQTTAPFFAPDRDLSRQIAQLKAAQRVEFERVTVETVPDEYVIAWSTVSSFEAAACTKLIALGADIAFVLAERPATMRLSARAGSALVARGLSVASILRAVAANAPVPIQVGGHDGAAGLNSKRYRELSATQLLELCRTAAREALVQLGRGHVGQ